MTKNLRFLFLLFLILTLSARAQTQERIVSGKVTSKEDGSALPGVNVVLKGTTIGTVTDAGGNYSISVPTAGGNLVFSFIGLSTVEVAIGDRTVVNVELTGDITQLGEVVVTAAGIERSTKSLGYSIENVNRDRLTQKSEPDLLRSLQGKVPGLNISSSSGLPGSSTRITIRGNSSLFGNNQPLFIVDGIPFDNSFNTTSSQLTGGTQYGSRIADLDPNNIESMTVLKGGAAAALYGVRAANGVIVITTKSGASKASRKGLEIAYSSGLAIEEISNLPDFQNKYGTGSRGNYAEANGSWGPAFDRPGPGVTYTGAGTFAPNGSEVDSIPYWSSYAAVFPLRPKVVPYQAYPNNVSDFFKTGKVFENSLSVTGGNDKSVLTAVLSRTTNEGFVPYSEFTRNNISLGGTTTLANGFNVGGNLSYISSLQKSPLLGTGGGSVLARTIYPGRNWDITGQPFENPNTLGNVFFLGAAADNPYWSAKNSGYESQVERMIASFNMGYDLNDWLNFSYKIGVNTYTESRKQYTRKGSVSAAGIGQLILDNISFKEIESNFLINAEKDLNENLRVKATLGHNINQRTNDRQSVTATNQVVFEIIDIDNFNSVVPNGGIYSQRRLMGVFADVTFNWKDYLFLNATGRNDWSSTLPVAQRSFFYPAVSSSFIFTEALNISSTILKSGKLRAGYSKVGNDAPVYSLFPTFAVNPISFAFAALQYSQDTPFLGQAGSAVSGGGTLYDPKLTPEFTTEFEIGTDLALLNDRVSLSFTYYDKRTTNQIAPIGLPAESGYNNLFTNFGEISNKGIEVGLNITPVSIQDGFSWDVYTTFTRNRNIVESLREGVDELVLAPLFTGSVTPKLIPGKPYGVLMGSVNLKDENGNFLIDPATGLLIESTDLRQIGDPNPDFLLGITNTFRFKGLSFSSVIDYKHGGDLYSNTNTFLLGRGVTTDTENREGTFIVPGVYGNANTGLPVLVDGNTVPNTTQVMLNDVYFQTASGSFAINGSDEVSVWDASVIRLREVAIGYELPKKLLSKTPFGNVSFSLTGRNLWYNAPNFPKGSNFDPEANSFGASNVQGVEYTTVPSVKRYGFNIRVTF